MNPKLSAFLSGSTDLVDKELVEWFSNLLEDLEIEPIFATHFPEPRPPQDKIQDFIRKSDIFVAVLTRRNKIEGKNLWTGPEWVQNEIAMAHTMKKPIALFVEKGVQVRRSIGQYITDIVRFDRNKLDSIRTKADRFVKALCDRVDALTPSHAEEKTVDQTVVDEAEEGLFEATIIDAARRILLWKCGRLDVSLKKFYISVLLLLAIPSLFVYDYFFGSKITGSLGAAIGLAVIIIMGLILYLTVTTRCKKCNSYFSDRTKPITYGDLKKFPNLPENRKLVKKVCEVCGNPRYDTIERQQ